VFPANTQRFSAVVRDPEKRPFAWQLFSASALADYRDAWRNLNKRTLASPILDPDFIEPLLQNFGRGNERLAVYGDPQQPQAMGVIAPRRLGVWETFQPHQAPVAPWVMEPTLDLEQLLATLMRGLPGITLLMGLTQQDPLLVPRPPTSERLRTLDYIQTVRVPVDGDFDRYWSRRGKNLRHNLKRQHNRIAKEGVAAEFDVLDVPKDVVEAVTDYGRLESAGWKSDAGTAVSPNNRQGRFYREVLDRFAQHGQAIVFRYRLNGQVAAMDLCIVQSGVLVILKTAYDESHAPFSPASLMREQAFRWIFRRGDIQSIEFYGRLMEWHTKWADDVRTLHHVNLYRWPLLASLIQLIPFDLFAAAGG